MMSHERKCVEKARKRRLTVCLLLAIIWVFTWSLWLNNWLRKYVFVKLMYVTICDLHGPPQVTGRGGNWKAVSSS